MGKTHLHFEGCLNTLRTDMEQVIPFVLGRASKYTPEVSVQLFNCPQASLEMMPFYAQVYFNFMHQKGELNCPESALPKFNCADNVIRCNIPDALKMEENRERFIQQFHKFIKSPNLPKLLAQSANAFIDNSCANKYDKITVDAFKNLYLVVNMQTQMTALGYQSTSIPIETVTDTRYSDTSLQNEKLYGALRAFSAGHKHTEEIARAA